MKVAITGSTGFIGRHLSKAFIARGDEVHPISKEYEPVLCDRIYHLACPSTTFAIFADPIKVMDTIFDGTRKALQICPTAIFINASTIGVQYITEDPQGCYNVAKLAMEHYLKHTQRPFINYRLPAVYGDGMNSDMFIKRCIDGTAYQPTEPSRPYFISHISDVVDALVELKQLTPETTTVGKVYEQFSSGQRGLSTSYANN